MAEVLEVKFLEKKVLQLTNEELDRINMDAEYENMKPYPEREYLYEISGVEHYRFLKWIANQISGQNIVELGSFNGLSTACLSSNKKNEVFAYDIDFTTLHFEEIPYNVTLEKVTGGLEWFDPYIVDGDIIFVDTLHYGIVEEKIWKYLKENKWTGVLIYDDIYYSNSMKKMWANIDIQNKHDITYLGHNSGTGIVFFY